MKYFLDEPAAAFEKKTDLPAGDPLLFAFQDQGLIVLTDGADPSIPSLARATELALPIEASAPLGVLGDRPCRVALVEKSAALPSGLEAKTLRRLFGVLDFAPLAVAAVASQLAHFFSMNRFCGACATSTVASATEHSVRCPRCERDIYPAIAPCVIILVHDGPRILLARQPRFPKGMFGLVAGFVEPGESLEACARREILEEVGVQVDDLRYIASQPWPFPSQLMCGMTARYTSGELTPDPKELEEAAWFDVDALPAIPPPLSIARHLIELHIAARKAHSDSK